MNLKTVILATFCLLLSGFNLLSQQAALIHSSYEDAIKSRKYLKLVRIREWGGETEEDEKKFFEWPTSVAVDKTKQVYICDQPNHHIRVFENNGNYLRTIGRKGRGPGDLYAPRTIFISPDGTLWVGEILGRRIQSFSLKGKSKTIFKFNGFIDWIGVTSKNEVAIYNRFMTFSSKKMLNIFNKKGKKLRQIGTSHDPTSRKEYCEVFYFALDSTDHFYACNTRIPLIRKYSARGKLLMALTFETPSQLPGLIKLNAAGDDIIRPDEIQNKGLKIEGKGKDGVAMQMNLQKMKRKEPFGGAAAFTVDQGNNIYIVARRRLDTERESKAVNIRGSAININRSMIDFEAVEHIDIYRLLVFRADGRVIGESPLETLCERIYVNGDRLFVIDGLVSQRIIEYRMIFKN